MADLYNNLLAHESLPTALRTTTLEGTSVDRANFDGVMAVLVVGTITDGSHAITLEESDDDEDWSTVAAGDLQGELPTLTSASDAGVVEVGYLGTGRYVRVVSTVSGGPSTGGVYGALVLGGHPFVAPVDRTEAS